MDDEPLWLFAYGSLIWRPGFAFERRVRGYAVDRVRRFWQASEDHRGVPGAPGRVVTLVPREGDRCWGVAYLVSPSDRTAVLERLDVREKGGYSLEAVDFVVADRDASERRLAPLAYIGGPENPHYVGEESLQTTASIVREASGPSGHNVDYVLRLADALLELNAEDSHVFELANELVDPDGILA